jgi:hemerythrin superfamily protein
MPSVADESASKKSRPAKSGPSKTGNKQDAIALLMADHDEVEELFREFQSAKSDDSEKADIVEKICKALSVHAEIEEDVFYPAARDALAEKGEDMLDEAEVEHASIKSLVEQLKDAEPDEDLYDAKVKVLCEYVSHHVKEEEGEMFPKIKKTSLDLEALGAELLERKTELMSDDED